MGPKPRREEEEEEEEEEEGEEEAASFVSQPTITKVKTQNTSSYLLTQSCRNVKYLRKKLTDFMSEISDV